MKVFLIYFSQIALRNVKSENVTETVKDGLLPAVADVLRGFCDDALHPPFEGHTICVDPLGILDHPQTVESFDIARG
jgi:hypothetical protein